MALPSVDYTPRDPSADVLHRVVRDHLRTFLAEAALLRDGEGVPRFVEQAGVPDARTGRVGVEWVLTPPHRTRYLVAWRHELCKAVVRVLLREVHRHLRTRARERGLSDVRGGAVAILQRFGGALNLNVHIHALVLDGVFARGDDERPQFHAAPALDSADVADVLAAVTPGVQRLAGTEGRRSGRPRHVGCVCGHVPLLAGLAAASVQGPESRNLLAWGRGLITRFPSPPDPANVCYRPQDWSCRGPPIAPGRRVDS